VSGGEKSTRVPRQTSHLSNFISIRSHYRRATGNVGRTVRRSRGHSRTGLIVVEAAGRSLWLLGDPKK
jgi:hypothetical protein